MRFSKLAKHKTYLKRVLPKCRLKANLAILVEG
jgi:hypothetical protein